MQDDDPNTWDVSDYPLVSPGVWVVIQLKSGKYWDTDKNGDKIEPAKYLNIRPSKMIIHYPDECVGEDGNEHTETICPDCIDSWAVDWYIVLDETQPSIQP